VAGESKILRQVLRRKQALPQTHPTGLWPFRNHLFVGRETRPTQITQFQLFAVASGGRFLGNIKEPLGLRAASTSVIEIFHHLRRIA
jgi:hypothetical protein